MPFSPSSGLLEWVENTLPIAGEACRGPGWRAAWHVLLECAAGVEGATACCCFGSPSGGSMRATHPTPPNHHIPSVPLLGRLPAGPQPHLWRAHALQAAQRPHLVQLLPGGGWVGGMAARPGSCGWGAQPGAQPSCCNDSRRTLATCSRGPHVHSRMPVARAAARHPLSQPLPSLIVDLVQLAKVSQGGQEALRKVGWAGRCWACWFGVCRAERRRRARDLHVGSTPTSSCPREPLPLCCPTPSSRHSHRSFPPPFPVACAGV